jgi:hypothetical protein
MTSPERPAAYLKAAGPGSRSVTAQQDAVARYSRELGWPAPAVYADPAGSRPGAALAALAGAVSAGRHDALIVAGSVLTEGPVPLLGLLLTCTRHGVPVRFALLPAPPPGRPAPPALLPAGRVTLE